MPQFDLPFCVSKLILSSHQNLDWFWKVSVICHMYRRKIREVNYVPHSLINAYSVIFFSRFLQQIFCILGLCKQKYGLMAIFVYKEIGKCHIEQTILYMITCPIEFVTPSSSDTRNNKSVFDFANGIILDLSSLWSVHISITGIRSNRFLETILIFSWKFSFRA